MNSDRFSSLFRPQSQGEASELVFATATYYPNAVRVYKPFTPFQRLKPGFEAVGSKLTKRSDNPEEDIERSLRRSRKFIRDYVLCNQFELFATFTFKADRQDTEKSRRKMSNWIKNEQKRKGKFGYLIVPELHKDGALHFHALIKEYQGKLKEAINPNTGKLLKQKGRQIYSLPSYRSGFTNAIKIDSSPDSQIRVSHYVGKYITKDMPQFFGKNRYWASSGLILPKTEDNPADWYKKAEPIYRHLTAYGVVMFFPREVAPNTRGAT